MNPKNKSDLHRYEGTLSFFLPVVKCSPYAFLDGALFFKEIQTKAKLLPAQLEKVLWELVAAGRISGDGFSAIRSLTKTKRNNTDYLKRRAKRFWGGRVPVTQETGSGRWWLMPTTTADDAENQQEKDPVQLWAWQLLERYGIYWHGNRPHPLGGRF